MEYFVGLLSFDSIIIIVTILFTIAINRIYWDSINARAMLPDMLMYIAQSYAKVWLYNHLSAASTAVAVLVKSINLRCVCLCCAPRSTPIGKDIQYTYTSVIVTHDLCICDVTVSGNEFLIRSVRFVFIS